MKAKRAGKLMVGVRGFEPPASASRTPRANQAAPHPDLRFSRQRVCQNRGTCPATIIPENLSLDPAVGPLLPPGEPRRTSNLARAQDSRQNNVVDSETRAPVAQWIEQGIPNPRAGVRFSPGAPGKKQVQRSTRLGRFICSGSKAGNIPLTQARWSFPRGPVSQGSFILLLPAADELLARFH